MPEEEGDAHNSPPVITLVETVRQNTVDLQELPAAESASYGLLHGCVSGPQGGAMGIHYANGDRVGDGELDAAHPEAMIYEQNFRAHRLM